MKTDLNKIFSYPFDSSLILKKKKSLKKELLNRDTKYIDKKITN